MKLKRHMLCNKQLKQKIQFRYNSVFTSFNITDFKEVHDEVVLLHSVSWYFYFFSMSSKQSIWRYGTSLQLVKSAKSYSTLIYQQRWAAQLTSPRPLRRRARSSGTTWWWTHSQLLQSTSTEQDDSSEQAMPLRKIWKLYSQLYTLHLRSKVYVFGVNSKWPLIDLSVSTLCPSLSLSFTIIWYIHSPVLLSSFLYGSCLSGVSPE